MWLTCIASPCCICCHAVLKSDTKRRCWGWQRVLMLTISRVQEMTMRNGILRLFLPSTNGMACIGGGKVLKALPIREWDRLKNKHRRFTSKTNVTYKVAMNHCAQDIRRLIMTKKQSQQRYYVLLGWVQVKPCLFQLVS